MCDFCDTTNDFCEHLVQVRNRYADENVCEKLEEYTGVGCEDCCGCTDDNYHYSIKKYGNRVFVEYYHKIGDFVISSASEGVAINYCPMCGRELMKG